MYGTKSGVQGYRRKHMDMAFVFVEMERFMNEATFEVRITLGYIRCIDKRARVLAKRLKVTNVVGIGGLISRNIKAKLYSNEIDLPLLGSDILYALYDSVLGFWRFPFPGYLDAQISRYFPRLEPKRCCLN